MRPPNQIERPKKRVGLVSAWASRLGGGVFEALIVHANLVRVLGYEVTVFALEDKWASVDRDRFDGIEVVTSRVIGPAVPGWSPAMTRLLLDAQLDLLHLHGVWLYPSRAASKWASITKRPYVISPHGMLDPWITGRGKLKKQIARIGYEKTSWANASAFHALTEAEARDIAVETKQESSTFVIPNAVNVGQGRSKPSCGPSVVYIGRIHPKKNLDALLNGWMETRELLASMGARLTIAGWGADSDVLALKQRIHGEMAGDVQFVGPVYGLDKSRLLSTAHFVALPSLSEGLPMGILEAWAAGTPTLMSIHCNLPQGFECGAAIDCGITPKSVAGALRRAVSMTTQEWITRSAASRKLAQDVFSPTPIQHAWSSAYNSLTQVPPVSA